MYETLSVYDNVMVSLQTDRKVFKYMFKRVTPEDNDRIWSILEFVELADKANDPVDTSRTASGSGSKWACWSPPTRS